MVGSKESNEASFVWYLQGFIVAMERLQLVENIMVVAPWYTVDRHAVILNLQIGIFLMFNLLRLYSNFYCPAREPGFQLRIANRGASTIFLSLSGTRAFLRSTSVTQTLCLCAVRAGLFLQITA